MKYIVAIDDTDHLKSYSTGIAAENLSKIYQHHAFFKCWYDREQGIRRNHLA